MSVQSGGFVRAAFNFDTSEPGELALRENDVIQVLYPVDDNWLCGNLYGQSVNFPANFVEPLALPTVEDFQKVFVATKDFKAEVDGDLGFLRGDIIVGLQPVDENWWNGLRGDETGIFPITHVFALEEEEVQTEVTPPGVLAEVAPPGGEPVSKESKVNATVRSTMDLTAQLDDELGFRTGDIIEVVEVIDSDFCIGRLNGKTGSFPVAFVELVSGNLHLETAKSGEVATHSKFDWWKDEKRTGESVSGISGKVVENDESVRNDNQTFSEKVENNNLQSSESVGSDNLQSPENDFEFKAPVPESNEKPSDEFKPTHTRDHSYNQINTSSYGVTLSAYGKAKFPFVAENDNELSFFDDDIILLNRHIDDEWMEGEIDGRRGLFPTSYIDIIVDCTRADVAVNKPEVGVETEMYGRVLYDFHAESSNELELNEGDTVTVVRKIDDDWIEARHDDGRVGCCPVTYVELITTGLGSEGLPQAGAPAVFSITPPVMAIIESSTAVSVIGDSAASGYNYQTEQVSTAIPTDITPSGLPVTPKPKIPTKPKLKPKPIRQQSLGSSESPAIAETVNVVKSKPPPLPAAPNMKPSLAEASLDDIVQQELRTAALGVANVPRSSSVPNNMSIKIDARNNIQGTSAVDYQTHSPQFIGQSQFYTDVSATKRSPTTKRRPPPRPSGPRPAPAPSRSVLEPQRASQSQANVPVPRRAAPPRPARSGKPVPARRLMRPPVGDDLMNFSPEKELRSDSLAPDNLEVMQGMEQRVAEIEVELEECSLELIHEECVLLEEEDDALRTDLHVKIQLCETKKEGLTEELRQLKDNLQDFQPQWAQVRVDSARQEEEKQRRAEQKRQRAAEEEKHREEEREKRRVKRGKVIEEILKTEADYLASLTLCLDTFFSPDAPKCPAVELETLFCNIDQIIELSQCLLTSLKGATCDRSFDEQIIGLSFMELKEDMQKAYSLYCCNHDDALCLLDKYEKNEEVQEYFGHMLESMKHQSVFFDLGSILIKPVQRILKYPLLLNALYKSTEPDHADNEHLMAAINSMTEVAGTINELKHRKDLVLKYRKDTDSKLSDKIARLSAHSAKKKFYRFTQKMVGVQKIDEHFLSEEKKFKDISLAVRLLVHDLSMYLERLQDSVACAESVANDLSDYYAEKSTVPEVEQFCEVHNQIATSLFQTFRSEVDVDVMQPLNRLLLMFQGPMKVIKKRNDKELDFNKMLSRVGNLRDTEQLGSMTEELQHARRTYEALNAQLLSELPQLYVLALDILQDSIARLVHAQKVFFDDALQLMEQLLSLSFVLCASDINIVDDFNTAHVSVIDTLTSLSFLPRNFFAQPEEKKLPKGRKSIEGKGPMDNEMGEQTDNQRASITQSYPPHQLFTVVQGFTRQQQMDVSASSNTVVGVIKEGDPMGNKDRWFVDTGGSKGFIPKKFLAPFSEDSTDRLTPDLISEASFDMSSTVFEASNISFDLSQASVSYAVAKEAVHLPDAPLEASSANEKAEMISSEEMSQCTDDAADTDTEKECQYYRAVYAFEARCPIEVTLRDGMLVKVLKSHDLDGNLEWWLVETENGCQGYAPANYLYKA